MGLLVKLRQERVEQQLKYCLGHRPNALYAAQRRGPRAHRRTQTLVPPPWPGKSWKTWRHVLQRG
ncbi:hypothetical protein [Mumia zhuanghuii]|uniref:Uncharacterized protein n=1 Tax=Mumia zhuanghuii TaxID=2585211 RepID=A0A5C4M9W0_9ACTN|nr:hypothetical protein [Mumia zhuanghuii]TNC31320.1 hypothetical protein FHE65_32135 [Mumia zhuanghuii]